MTVLRIRLHFEAEVAMNARGDNRAIELFVKTMSGIDPVRFYLQ